MRSPRRHIALVALTLAGTVVTASPALAHGDHDARPLLRHAQAGPYSVSLWQVYPDVGSAMTPHLIVTFDDPPPESTQVTVVVDSAWVDVVPSMTTPGAWETLTGVLADDVVRVTVSNVDGGWEVPTVVIPHPLTSVLPMRALIMISIFLASGVAWWAGGRTARAWRRPLPEV